jgi:hypothetical protein
MKLHLLAIVASTAGITVASCGEETHFATAKAPLEVKASPPGFMFNGSTTVELDASRPSEIFYTLNGGDPTKPTAMVYTGPIEVAETTLITFIAVAEDKTWSSPVAEFYESAPPSTPAPSFVQRGLQIDENNHFFAPRPGDTNLSTTFHVKSIGIQSVHINQISIGANPAGLAFYEDGAFTLDATYENIDLAPGKTLELTVHYAPTQTLRSAAIYIDSDELLHDASNQVYAELWGRIFN